jgi:hypothetical protein
LALAVGLAALSAVAASTASAATCTGPERTFDLVVSSGCYAYGTGNINGNPAQDPLIAGADIGGNTITYVAAAIPGLDFITDITDWTSSSGATSVTGSVTVSAADVAGFTNLVLALKVGNNKDPSWASFLIAGAGTFDFTISPKQGSGISHVNLYGTPGVVPLPASGLLLAGLFGGLFGYRRLRKS